MPWRNSWSITEQTHEKLTSICENFRTNYAILTSYMHADLRTCRGRGFSRGCYHVAWSYGESCEILLCFVVLSMLSPRGEDRGHMWGIWLFRIIFGQNPHRWGPKIWSNQIKYPPSSNVWFSDEKRVGIINNPHNAHKVKCSINLYWKWVVRSSVFV